MKNMYRTRLLLHLNGLSMQRALCNIAHLYLSSRHIYYLLFFQRNTHLIWDVAFRRSDSWHLHLCLPQRQIQVLCLRLYFWKKNLFLHC